MTDNKLVYDEAQMARIAELDCELDSLSYIDRYTPAQKEYIWQLERERREILRNKKPIGS